MYIRFGTPLCAPHPCAYGSVPGSAHPAASETPPIRRGFWTQSAHSTCQTSKSLDFSRNCHTVIKSQFRTKFNSELLHPGVLHAGGGDASADFRFGGFKRCQPRV